MKKFFKGLIAIVMIIAIGLLTNFMLDFFSFAHGSESLAMAGGIGFAMRKRGVYNTALHHCKIGPDGKILIYPAPSFLRVEATIELAKSGYVFRFRRTENTSLPEMKLDPNDKFIMSEIGLLLTKQDSTKIGQEVLCAFPNPTVFSGDSALDADKLEAIYNGYAQLKVSTKVEIESMFTGFFRKVPQVYKKAGISQVETAISNTEFDLRDMLYELESLIVLNGTDDASFTVTIPQFTGSAFVPGSNCTYKLVFLATGLLIKDAATV